MMDDFRAELGTLIDTMVAGGVQPVFLAADLVGVAYIKRAHGAESLDAFRSAAMASISGAASGAEVFAYGEQTLVAILPGYARLKTFAIIDKLRRVLPLLAQSFDCILELEFDTFEYEADKGVAGLISQLVKAQAMRNAA